MTKRISKPSANCWLSDFNGTQKQFEEAISKRIVHPHNCETCRTVSDILAQWCATVQLGGRSLSQSASQTADQWRYDDWSRPGEDLPPMFTNVRTIMLVIKQLVVARFLIVQPASTDPAHQDEINAYANARAKKGATVAWSREMLLRIQSDTHNKRVQSECRSLLKALPLEVKQEVPYYGIAPALRDVLCTRRRIQQRQRIMR